MNRKRMGPPASRGLGCVDVTEEAIANLFVDWNKALQTENPNTVVALYALDAALLPTLESGPLIGHAQIRPYFVEFLKKKPFGRIDKRTIRIGCNVAFDAGLYTFTYGTGAPACRLATVTSMSMTAFAG